MDFAENWCSLLELFVSNAGLKLRMFMVDTVLIKSGRVLGHFYTSKDGYICRFSAHEITRQAIYQRLASLHCLDPQLNPFGYIGVAHYATGVSRLLKRAELQDLMTTICGPYEFSDSSPIATQHEQLFCVQAYIVPRHDMRYIASYDVQEGPLCTVLARRFSSRYTNAMDDPASVLVETASSDPDEPARTSSILAGTTSINRPLSSVMALSMSMSLDDPLTMPSSLTADELLVESQLVAMGLLEPRRQKEREPAAAGAEATGGGAEEAGVGSGVGGGDDAGATSPSGSPPDGITSSLPAPRRVKDDVARLLQAASSFVERAHGQRIVGLVAEFITAGAPTPGLPSGGGLVLMAVHAVQLDPRASRGRLGTFTERWTDYLEGLAPPPAPQAPGRRNQSPSILRAGDSSLVMTERSSGFLVRTSPGSSMGSMGGAGGSVLPVYGGAFNPQRQVLGVAPTGVSGGAGSGNVISPRVHGGAGSGASSPAAGSLTRIYSASPSAAHHRSMTALSDVGRPGSAPAAVVKVGRHLPNAAHSSALNGHYTLRNAMSAARPGGGGNPTANPGAPDSYSLWLSREGLPTDSMSAKLALEVESLRERLQRQTDIAVRAEAALQQLAVSSRKETMELRQQIEELRIEVGRLGEAKRNLATEYDRLRSERLGLQAGRSELSGEVERLRTELAGERETLAKAVRDATAREEQLEGQLRAAREEREEALKQLGGLRRRVEEESEVVEALRGQLYDYKQLVAQLQAQVRRGRNNKQLLQSLQGLPGAIASAANLNAAGGSGGAAAGDGTAAARGGRNTKDGEESDADTDAGGGASGGMDGTGSQQGGQKPLPGGGGGATGRQGVVGAGYGGRRPSNTINSAFHHGGSSPPHHRQTFTSSSPHGPDHGASSPRRGASPFRGSVGSGPANRSVTVVPPTSNPTPAAATTAASSPLMDVSGAAGPTNLLSEIRRKRVAAGGGPPLLALERADSSREGPSVPAANSTGGASAGGSATAAAPNGNGGAFGAAVGPAAAAAAGATSGGGTEGGTNAARPIAPPSPTGSISGTTDGPVLVSSASLNGKAMVVGLGARKPNYDMVQVYDLFLMSWIRESLTPRMLECHGIALQEVAAEETALAEIFNFYGQLGQVVWLDSRLTMNEKQFVKLALETGVPESSTNDMREVFQKLSDKTEFASEAASNHPHPYINFEQFPEAVLRLAALRYEWRPPENLEDAEEELYFASPPFMPPNPRESQLGDGDEEPPPRPPETVFVQIVKAYLKDDLLIRARRFKTAGSTQAKFRSQLRTAPQGLWLSSKSLTAGI
ncbi:hypothetical protein VaNZ11_016709 [Volvox africanus]|uniref:Uncharacterized protein n=1 Tax=Volvox africanus TaxID=51714 RepID=A0ABQ5SQ40_9CHLO|nr:hypothetical protein VaNZ11_016709 [Volvox africanus]